jgi:hypothetical protein
MKIIACNSNRPLAEAVAAALGIPLTQASVRRFADMEIFAEINDRQLPRLSVARIRWSPASSLICSADSGV